MNWRILTTLKPQLEGQRPALKQLRAHIGIDDGAQDLVRGIRRHLLDVRAALGGGHEQVAPQVAVHQRAQVELPVDVRTGLHIDLGNRLALGVRLRGHQATAQPALGKALYSLQTLHQDHPPCLAAPPCMGLDLNHPTVPAKLLRGRHGLLRRGRRPPQRHRQAVISE